MFPGNLRILTMAILLIRWPIIVMKFLIHVASRIARIMIRSKPGSCEESDLIEKSWAGEKLLIRSRYQQWSNRCWDRTLFATREICAAHQVLVLYVSYILLIKVFANTRCYIHHFSLTGTLMKTQTATRRVICTRGWIYTDQWRGCPETNVKVW